MTTYWHVAHPSYQQGEDLVCWNTAVERGWLDESDWKWPDAEVGFDGHVVCLYPDTEEGRQQVEWHRDDYPDGILVRVEIDDDDLLAPSDWQDPEISMTTVEEGFPAVRGSIPARCITVMS